MPPYVCFNNAKQPVRAAAKPQTFSGQASPPSKASLMAAPALVGCLLKWCNSSLSRTMSDAIQGPLVRRSYYQGSKAPFSYRTKNSNRRARCWRGCKCHTLVIELLLHAWLSGRKRQTHNLFSARAPQVQTLLHAITSGCVRVERVWTKKSSRGPKVLPPLSTTAQSVQLYNVFYLHQVNLLW